MLSVQSGHSTGYLTGAVAGGRENYYTDAVDTAGEPAGVWYGAGAEALGLRGEVDADLMEAVYTHHLDPRDPATHDRAQWGEVQATLGKGDRAYRSADEVYQGLLGANPDATPEQRAEMKAQAAGSGRQNIAFEDITFSPPKSVTVMHVAFERAANDARRAGDLEAAEAWATHARAVEDAVMAGARASIDYLEEHAGVARVGKHGGGAGRFADTEGWTVAQFLQHDSRDRDPQLHVHQAVMARVQRADGEWGKLWGGAINNFKAAAGAIAARVMEAHLEHSLGVRSETRPDGTAREVMGVGQDVMDLFSSRSRAITPKVEQLCQAFEARHGREPSTLERHRISQQATLATRSAKSHDGETAEQRLDRWERECRESLSSGLGDVARHVLDRAQQLDPSATWEEEDVIDRARAAFKDARASWTRSDMTRSISDALPGHLGLPPEEVRELLEGLTDKAMEGMTRLSREESTDGVDPSLLRRNGQSVYEVPGAAKYALPEQLGAEREFRKAALELGAERLTTAEVDAVVARFAEAGRKLGDDQAAALRGVLTSGARMEVLSAAAGSGKSFTVGAIAQAWTEAGRRVIGVAPSQVAARVLAEEGLAATANVTAWLGAQERLEAAAPGRPVSARDEALRLRAGDILIVDEAGMTPTADLVEVQRHAREAGAKVLLVGDPRQLGAVGPGGALADIAERGLRYELTEVRRFNSVWEGPASLRLRDGDASALDEYGKHGRLWDGGTAEQAEEKAARAWLGDTLAGKESLLLVGSNEAAARVSAQLRAELVSLGRVEENGVALGRDGWQGVTVGVGDRIQGRLNAWHLATADNPAPINRATYSVTATLPGGGLRVVDERGAELTLPAGYVHDHVTLAYAATVHSAQGRTVDSAHAVLARGTDAGAAYVALTRGREANHAWVITRAVAPDAETGQTHEVQERTARAVLADVLASGVDRDSGLTATALAEREAEAARSVQTALNRLAAEVADVTAGRVGAELDRLVAAGALSVNDRVRLAADPAVGGLDRLLRQVEVAGHDPAEVLRNAVASRDFTGAHSAAQTLHSRITSTLKGQLTPKITSGRELIPAGLPETARAGLERLADAVDDRRRELGARIADEPPQWAREALGPVPEDTLDRAEWEHKAGWAAAYREMSGHADEAVPLGSAPPAGLAEAHALWHAAHGALDLPDAGAEEGELSTGQLRARVRAYQREETWAPRWVGDELEAAHQATEKARTDAEVWSARAAAATDPGEAERLREDAEKARTEAVETARTAEDLEAADEARQTWSLHTAVTRDRAERARAELSGRGVTLDDPAEQVTAEEWLEAHRDDQAVEDAHQEIGEHDLDNKREIGSGEPIALKDDLEAPTASSEAVAETAVEDVREVSTTDAGEHTDADDRGRVPTRDETREAVERAQAALAEILARDESNAADAGEDEYWAAYRDVDEPVDAREDALVLE